MDKWIHFDYGDSAEVYLKGNFEGEGFAKKDFSNESGKAIYIENHNDGATVTEIPFGEEFDRLMQETSSYLNFQERWDELDNEFSYDHCIKYLAENQYSAIDSYTFDDKEIFTSTVTHTQFETSKDGVTALLKENGIDIDDAQKEGKKFNYISETVSNIRGENGILEIRLSPARLAQAIDDIERENNCKVETVPITSYVKMTKAVFLTKDENEEAHLELVTLNNNAHYSIPLNAFEKEALGELQERMVKHAEKYYFPSITAYPDNDKISVLSHSLFEQAMSLAYSNRNQTIHYGEWEIASKYPSIHAPEELSEKEQTLYQMYHAIISTGMISESETSFEEFEKDFQAIEATTEEEYCGTYTRSQIFTVNENGTVEITTNFVEKDETENVVALQSGTTTISSQQAIDELRSSIENVKNFFGDGNSGVYLKKNNKMLALQSNEHPEFVIGVFRRGEPCLEIYDDGRVTGDKKVAEELRESLLKHQRPLHFEEPSQPKKQRQENHQLVL